MTTIINRPTEVGVLPVTDSQLGLLVLDRQIEARHLYNLTYQVELTRPIEPARLRAALELAAHVQPALRTVFRSEPDTHATVTAPRAGADFPFRWAELTDEADIPRTVDEIGDVRFDLYDGPTHGFAYLYSPQRAVLVMGVHHAVFCHFSMRPFLQDVHWALTEQPGPAEVAELRAVREEMYAAEYAAQQRNSTSEATAALADELADRLRGAPALTLYPHPRRAADTRFRGTRVDWLVVDDDAATVNAACADHRITPYEFFMSVFSATVGRHAATDDVTVGNVFFSRRTAGALSLSGYFVNTLPVRVNLDWSASFGEFTRSTLHSAVEFARTRGKVSFNDIVERLNPNRVGQRNPVFSCLFAMYDQPHWPDTVRSVRQLGNHTAKFDLWMGVSAIDGGWRVELEWDRDLVPAEVGARIQASVRSAIERAGTDRGASLATLFDDASAAESVRTDGYWSAPVEHSLVDWIRATAARQPERPAIEHDGGTLSYAELDAAAGRVAAALRDMGVRPGDVIGLCLDDLVATATAMLGVMWSGAAYLPLDRSLPEQRLAHMTRTAGCTVVIGEGPVPGVRSVTMDELDTGRAPSLATVTSAASYVMFTSGSTGLPKGIHMAQSALRNLTAWQLSALDMDADTRFLQYAPLGFDVSFQEIVPTLCAGGTVVSRQPVARRDFPALVERIVSTGVTHLYLPVAALRSFALAVADAGVTLDRLTHLCVSGEQLVIDDGIRALFRANPTCVLVNLYGPTETHAVITRRFTAPSDTWPGHAPIGVPLTGVTAYVVDVTGHLAPTGVAGELRLGGECPALGYINDVARTEAAFLPDRFGGGTMYRTGDQVLRDVDGDLIFLGRDDDQVKVRGFRVELGEIAGAARAVSGVREAVAAVGDAERGEIVLFVIADGIDGGPIRSALRATLPDYMMPARIVFVDRIPATDNGKFDRAALLRELRDEPAAALETVTYASTLERELAQMWAALLTVPVVAPGRSLLDYGAHSIMMFNSVRQIKKRYDVQLSIADLFGALTIAELAVLIEGRRRP